MKLDDGGPDDTGPTDSDSPPPPDACDDSPGLVLCDGRTAIECDAGGDIAAEVECDPEGEVCVDAVGCTACAVSLAVELSTPDVAPRLVVVDGLDSASLPGLRHRLRRLVVSLDPALSGEGELTWTDPVVAWSESGEELVSPLRFAPDAPPTLLLAASAEGEGAVAARWVPPDEDPDHACAAGAASLAVVGVRPVPVVGRALEAFPWLYATEVMNAGEVVVAGVDPGTYADRAGLPFDAWLVPHRSPAEWAADATLVAPAAFLPDQSLAGGLADSRLALLDAAPTPDDPRGAGYDLVLDFGRDGTLDPGDLAWGPGDAAATVTFVGDLGEPGPHGVVQLDYSGGRWLGQRLYYPDDAADLAEPAPLVVISHGNGHNYTWYDYLGRHLASWGYVVMAHENETGPGIETASETTLDNTDFFLANLDVIAGGALVGHVDGSRIVWIGHSRGGEGVVRAMDRLVDGDARPTMYGADDVVLISSIAPTVFLGVDASNPHTTAYHLIAGAADGDVNGSPSCSQCEFFRIPRAADGEVQVTYLQGVGHNEFNCCGPADTTGPDQLGRDATQAIAIRYYLALLEAHVGGRPWLSAYFTRMFDDLAPLGITEAAVGATWYQVPRDEADGVVDDFQAQSSVTIGSAGGSVTLELPGEPVEDGLYDADDSFTWRDSDPMNGMTQYELSDGRGRADRGLVFDWTVGEEALATWSLPFELVDVRAWEWLSLRACQGTRHPETDALDGPLTFAVTLIDADGGESTLPVAAYGSLTRPYPRSGSGAGAGWANEFATVRLRLTDFAADGADLDLSRVAAVQLRFGESWGSERGRVAVDDLELVR